MNLVLLHPEDFTDAGRVRIGGRRRDHVLQVHRVTAGDELIVGQAGGKIGSGTVLRVGEQWVELQVTLDRDPPPPAPITLVVALPRPKVLNRLLASVTALGIKRIILINAWRVEKSYWRSPRLQPANLLQQQILGLEQAIDTVLPKVELKRLFRPFVEGELPEIARGSMALLAHPRAGKPCPGAVEGAVTLVVGPEGGFIEQEIASLQAIGFLPVTIGPRVLRVETAVAALVGRLV